METAVKHYQTVLNDIVGECSKVILGKELQLKLALTCILADGHLLIEDIPGVGKTTLAHTLAHVLGLHYQRIQFTSDLLPADVLGGAVFNKNTAEFEFHPGPIFNQIVLADEINRTTPKTQSALLEAMEEKQVSIEGKTRPLPEPFFVIATQNPLYQIGTFPLPESQLDRFLIRIHLGYPNKTAERQLLAGESRKDLLKNMATLLPFDELIKAQNTAKKITVSEAILDFIQDIIYTTRNDETFTLGLSPRAGLAIVSAAKAWAMQEGRTFVIPEDVQAILPAVAGHRIVNSESTVEEANAKIEELINKVAIP